VGACSACSRAAGGASGRDGLIEARGVDLPHVYRVELLDLLMEV
jgi:hypothetical protein